MFSSYALPANVRGAKHATIKSAETVVEGFIVPLFIHAHKQREKTSLQTSFNERDKTKQEEANTSSQKTENGVLQSNQNKALQSRLYS